MLFIIKKCVGSLMQPLPLVLLIMGLALLLIWFTRWQRSGKSLLTLSWLMLLLVSFQPVADFWLKPLERQYTTWQGGQSVSYVVVLGSRYTYNPAWAPSANLSGIALARLAEGIRLYRQNPGSKLILTGGKAEGNPVSSAQVSEMVALSLGVPQRDIITLELPKDTEDEANTVNPIVGKQPFLLVTSASHLPRAMVIFNHRGMSPIAAPADQLAIDSPLNFWEQYFPAAHYLAHSEALWHESLGRIFLWFKLQLEQG
ncbi:MAG: envelope biogenesis factor ElyC [Enterobacteriaceae bacterium]